jgi:hypothetical protein
MNVWVGLKILAALATAAIGSLALVKPNVTYGFIGLNVSCVRGVSEIRAIFAGMFIALGIVPLFLGTAAYKMLGISFLGIAVAHTISILFDKSYAQSNFISLAIKIVLGAILII